MNRSDSPSSYTPSQRTRPSDLGAPWVPIRAAHPSSRFVAYLHQDVVDTLREAARTRPDDDSVGWLLGRAYVDADGPYAFARLALTAPEPRRGPSSISTSAADDEHYARLMHTCYPHLDPLGWWRWSGPANPEGVTEADRERQQSWCTAEHQFGLRAAGAHGAISILGYHGPQTMPLGELRLGDAGVAPEQAMVVTSAASRPRKRVTARQVARAPREPSGARSPGRWRRAFKAVTDFIWGALVGSRDDAR